MDTPTVICKRIVTKRKAGMSQRAIAKELNVSQSAVARVMKRYNKTGELKVQRQGKCGRKRKLSARTVRMLSRKSAENPRSTARELQASVCGELATVSLSTVKRSLARSGIVSHRPVKSPSWTSDQMKVRFQWAKAHQNWSVQQWEKVFLDIVNVCYM
jgi:transposase